MQDELSKSGLSEEAILEKTKAVMKAFATKKDDSSTSATDDTDLLDLSLVSKQNNSALKMAQVSPKEFAKARRMNADCLFVAYVLQLVS